MISNIMNRLVGSAARLWDACLRFAPEPLSRRLRSVQERLGFRTEPRTAPEVVEPEVTALPDTTLNDKERSVLQVLLENERAMRLDELAGAAFGTVSGERANSWVRNSLRRLVRDGKVERVDRGAYRATAIRSVGSPSVH